MGYDGNKLAPGGISWDGYSQQAAYKQPSQQAHTNLVLELGQHSYPEAQDSNSQGNSEHSKDLKKQQILIKDN